VKNIVLSFKNAMSHGDSVCRKFSAFTDKADAVPVASKDAAASTYPAIETPDFLMISPWIVVFHGASRSDKLWDICLQLNW
jgi:hypothetical protein